MPIAWIIPFVYPASIRHSPSLSLWNAYLPDIVIKDVRYLSNVSRPELPACFAIFAMHENVIRCARRKIFRACDLIFHYVADSEIKGFLSGAQRRIYSRNSCANRPLLSKCARQFAENHRPFSEKCVALGKMRRLCFLRRGSPKRNGLSFWSV